MAGSESFVEFLQEFSKYQTKESLVYDLQEPFRWIADVTVMEAFESRVLDLPDFYFTGDDYRYRFEPEAEQRFLDLLRERFNVDVTYNGRVLKWDTVIERKTVELARYLANRSPRVDFLEASPSLCGSDDRELRRRILSLTQHDARKLGIGKSALHYLRGNANAAGPLTIYNKTAARIRDTEPRNADVMW